MKAVNDLDFLSLFWVEAKAVGQRVLKDLPQFNEPLAKSNTSLMYLIKFSDLTDSWSVKDILAKLVGKSITLKILGEKINYMILKGRANDVKPMLIKICSGRIKHLQQPPSKYSNNDTQPLGRGHFRWDGKAQTLTTAELEHVKKYFNI
jgi:hypothetical protein